MDVVPHHDDLEGIAPPIATWRLCGRGREWTELTEAYASGRLHHAWLLQGMPGIGKATTALAFARFVLGDAPEGEAEDLRFDAERPATRQIAQGAHPRLLHLTRPAADRGEGFKTQITVDEVRRLNHFLQSTSAGGWRVVVLDPADDLNRNAANALLKILEEPPPRSLFLIVNHAAGRILPTIRSRCRVLRFEPLADAVLRRRLQALMPDTDEAARGSAAAAAGGSLRAALVALLNGGAEIEEVMRRLVGAPVPDWTAIHALTDSLTQRGREASFTLALDALSSQLAEDAVRALDEHPRLAARIAALQQSETARWRQAAAYNLDRKQVLLSFFQTLQDLRAEPSA